MQTTFLTKYKPILGSGQQKKLEVNNHRLPTDLTDEIEESVVSHFDRAIEWSIKWSNEWTKRPGISLKVCRLSILSAHWLIFIVDCYVWRRSIISSFSDKVQRKAWTIQGVP
jgi:hypothetical protein